MQVLLQFVNIISDGTCDFERKMLRKYAVQAAFSVNKYSL
jgi:hypothetical protein